MAHFVNVTQLDQVVDAMCTANDARFLKQADVLSYTIKKADTADEGYLSTYQLYSIDANDTETAIGAKINLPKDFLVKSASTGTVTEADKAAGGKFENDSDFAVGDKYIDFVINVKEGTATDEHLYLNVSDFDNIYTAGNGLVLSNEGEFSLVVDSSNANGLSVSANGLALATAAASTEYVAATGTYVAGTTYYTDATGATTVDTSSFEEGVTDVSSYFVASTTYSAGAMSATDKAKLDGIEEATASEITAIINGMYSA